MSTDPPNKLFINVTELKIMIDPIFSGAGGEPVQFVGSMLKHPDYPNMNLGSAKPFFTQDAKIPTNQITKYDDYASRLKVMFTKSTFEAMMLTYFSNTKVVPLTQQLKIAKEKDNKDEVSRIENEINSVSEFNVSFILQIIFPTTIPAKLNLTTSLSEIIKQKNESSITLKSLTSKPKFSYIQLGSNTYTITKVMVLNDVVNHPVYKKVYNDFIDFDVWRERELKNNTDSINVKYAKLLKNLNDSSEGKGLKLEPSVIDVLIQDVSDTITKLEGTENRNVTSNTLTDYRIKQNSLEKIKSSIETLNALLNIPDSADASSTMDNKSKMDNLVPHLTNIITLAGNLTKATGSGHVDFPKKFMNKLNAIDRELQYFNKLERVINTYLKSNATSILPNEEPEIIEYIKKDFPRIETFGNNVNSISFPARRSTNPYLQTIISNTLNPPAKDNESPFMCGDKKIVNFGDLVDEIRLLTINPDSSCMKNNADIFMNTGISFVDVTKTNTPEVYISFSAINDIVTSENAKLYKCAFRSNSIENVLKMFTREYNKFDVEKHLILIPKIEVPSKNGLKTKKAKPGVPPAPAAKPTMPSVPVTKGGRGNNSIYPIIVNNIYPSILKTIKRRRNTL